MSFRALLNVRATREAKLNWAERYRNVYANHPNMSDVREGFTAGFVETASGLAECPPPVPHRRLLSRHSITHSYPNPVAWYDGYSLGHAVAISQGVDRWRLIPINPDLLPCNEVCETVALNHAETDPMGDGEPGPGLAPAFVEPIPVPEQTLQNPFEKTPADNPLPLPESDDVGNDLIEQPLDDA